MIQVDVVIVGGGSAGLSAALVLGRARRRVVLCDGGAPRNAPSPAVHGFFTRDGTPPDELLAMGHAQLDAYPSVERRRVAVSDVVITDGGFSVHLDDGTQLMCRKLLLASGVVDELPAIPGLAALWGHSALHCPYCHGWEVRDTPLAVLANGDVALHLAPLVRAWSDDVVLCTNGPATFDATARARLSAAGIALIEEAVERLDATGTQLERIVFAGGTTLARHALFVRPAQRQRSDLAVRLGCAVDANGSVTVDTFNQTSVPGVFAAGDMTSLAQQAIIAAAQGAFAAGVLNNALVHEAFVAAVASERV